MLDTLDPSGCKAHVHNHVKWLFLIIEDHHCYVMFDLWWQQDIAYEPDGKVLSSSERRTADWWSWGRWIIPGETMNPSQFSQETRAGTFPQNGWFHSAIYSSSEMLFNSSVIEGICGKSKTFAHRTAVIWLYVHNIWYIICWQIIIITIEIIALRSIIQIKKYSIIIIIIIICLHIIQIDNIQEKLGRKYLN